MISINTGGKVKSSSSRRRKFRVIAAYMRVRRNLNGMKRNEKIGLFTKPSIFIDKSGAIWIF